MKKEACNFFKQRFCEEDWERVTLDRWPLRRFQMMITRY